MKRMMLFTLLLMCGLFLRAQTERRLYTKAEQESQPSKEESKPSRAERKRMEQVLDSLNHVRALNAIEQLAFVLEADRVTFKRGTPVYVTSHTNFISLSDDEAVVQVSPVMSGGGPNGVGGITLKGKASNIVLKTDKKGNVTLQYSVNGSLMSATVNLQMLEGTNEATATIDPNLHSGRITLRGVLVPLEESNVFEGQSF